MIGKMDDYLIHQATATLDQVVTLDPNWQDRFYFNIHDRQGQLCAITGLGVFPNERRMDGYFMVIHNGHHYSYRAGRVVTNDREEMRAGGLNYSVVEPLRHWRLELNDQDNGIRAELEFRARTPIYEFRPVFFRKPERVVVDQQHYTQAGTYEGSLTIGGQRITGLIGLRDRSWGIRNMLEPGVMWVWISAQFQGYCVTGWFWETAEGERFYTDGAVVKESGEVVPFVTIRHRLELWPGSRRPRIATYDITDAQGRQSILVAEEMDSIYLGPAPSHWQASEQETVAAADRAARGFDQFCRFRYGNDEGIGIVEYMMGGGWQPYGIPPAATAAPTGQPRP